MYLRRAWLVVAGVIFIAACQSESQPISNEQAAALNTAFSRAQVTAMGYQTNVGTALPNNAVQPVLLSGQQGAEYAIAVENYRSGSTSISICPVPSLGTTACSSIAGQNNPSIGLRP